MHARLGVHGRRRRVRSLTHSLARSPHSPHTVHTRFLVRSLARLHSHSHSLPRSLTTVRPPTPLRTAHVIRCASAPAPLRHRRSSLGPARRVEHSVGRARSGRCAAGWAHSGVHSEVPLRTHPTAHPPRRTPTAGTHSFTAHLLTRSLTD